MAMQKAVTLSGAFRFDIPDCPLPLFSQTRFPADCFVTSANTQKVEQRSISIGLKSRKRTALKPFASHSPRRIQGHASPYFHKTLNPSKFS